jgi:F-type H+-transporting ATPase subunit b
MSLVTPDFGLVFWMVISFLIVLFILKRFAWKPILLSLRSREESIDSALKSAEKAREEMTKLKGDNEKILAEARLEREQMMKEAREMKEKIISDAKKSAGIEADKLIEMAKIQIQNEKNNAVAEIKVTVVELSVQIAEKILQKNLDSDSKQKDYAESLLKDINLN